jgi:hypothetical protein
VSTYYVRTNGADGTGGHDGTTPAKAWLTVGYAVTNVAAGDTIWVGAGIYRVGSSISPPTMASLTHLYGDVAGAYTGDAGEVRITNWATNDTTAPYAGVTINMPSAGNWEFRWLTFCGGGSYTSISVTSMPTGTSLIVRDCAFLPGGVSIIPAWPTSGTTILVERNRFLYYKTSNGPISISAASSEAGAGTSVVLNAIVRNNLIIGGGGSVAMIGSTTGAMRLRAGGITFTNNLMIGSGVGIAVYAPVTQGSFLIPNIVTNNVLIGNASTAMVYSQGYAAISNNNVIINSGAGAAFSRITAGPNDVTDASLWPGIHFGQEYVVGAQPRPFGMPSSGSPLLTRGCYGIAGSGLSATVTDDSSYGTISWGNTTNNVRAGNVTVSANVSSASSYVTASVSLVSGQPYYLLIYSTHASSAPVVASVTGGPTWVSRATTQFNGTLNRVSLWSATAGSNYTGTLTIDFSGNTQTGCGWSLDEATGIDATTNDGIVQSAVGSGSGTVASASLGAFGSTQNGTYAGLSDTVFSGLSGSFSLLGQQGSGPSITAAYSWLNVTPQNVTINSSAWGFIAAELKSTTTFASLPWDGTGRGASSALASQNNISHFLNFQNFGFAIPTDATILGLAVDLGETVSSASTVQSDTIKFIKGGTIGGSNVISSPANITQDASYPYTVPTRYGSAASLYGQAFTPSDINASNFGVAVAYKNPTVTSSTVTVWAARIVVSYTSPSQSPTDDIMQATRPASGVGTVTKALGPYERSNSGTLESSIVRPGATYSVKIAGPGYHDFEMAVDAVATTYYIYAYWDGSYAGTLPTVKILNGAECGVADTSTTATGSSGAWNIITVGPFTPTSAGIVTVRLDCTGNTAGGGNAYFDTGWLSQ